MSQKEEATDALVAHIVAKQLQAATVALTKQLEDAKREMLANNAISHARRTTEPPSPADLAEFESLKIKTTDLGTIVKLVAQAQGYESDTDYIKRGFET